MEEFNSIIRVNFIFQTRLSKILTIKKDWITQLKDMNTEAEKRVSKFSDTYRVCTDFV